MNQNALRELLEELTNFEFSIHCLRGYRKPFEKSLKGFNRVFLWDNLCAYIPNIFSRSFMSNSL